MHYSKHRLMALVAYVTTLAYASTNDQWARPALSIGQLHFVQPETDCLRLWFWLFYRGFVSVI